MFKETVDFIRNIYKEETEQISLHEPRFIGKEKEYLNDCIDSTYVSSVGKYVNLFEDKIKELTGANYAIATSNGTSALHLSLILAGVKSGDLVITQPLTFIATCNSITYLGAEPLFVDIDLNTLGLSAEKLADFFGKKTVIRVDGFCYHKESGKRISACVPMHTFGHPAEIDKIADLCKKYKVALVEDAAESIGSYYKNKHTGVFGLLGTMSFNGNKTITCGGGGMIITNDEKTAKLAKHLSTQAKIPQRWDFEHDMTGYNYRLPNLNAALACAQMEQLDSFIQNKRELALIYKEFFAKTPFKFVVEPENCKSNYWLNAILLKDRTERDEFLKFTNDNGVLTRPAWILMNKLKMFEKCITENIDNSVYIEDRLVNLPSSVRVK
jgi:aminotransferase in exopolysaccharide biosynthesis